VTTVKLNRISPTEVEIEGEVSADKFESYRTVALKSLSANIEIDGFRKGFVPENILSERLGPGVILEEMAERVIREEYPKIITEHKIEAIDRPSVHITKIAPGNPLCFKITQQVLPEIKLPDYRQIVARKNKNKHIVLPQAGGIDTDIEKNKNVNHEKEKENEDEKRLREEQKHRVELIEAILAETEIQLPSSLVERQMDRFVIEAQDWAKQINLKWEDYLTRIKKSEKEWRDATRLDAEKRVRTELLLNVLARTEKIEVPEKELTRELESLLVNYKNADTDSARTYLTSLLRNQHLFALLESL